jgi:hypothetical protein
MDFEHPLQYILYKIDYYLTLFIYGITTITEKISSFSWTNFIETLSYCLLKMLIDTENHLYFYTAFFVLCMIAKLIIQSHIEDAILFIIIACFSRDYLVVFYAVTGYALGWKIRTMHDEWKNYYYEQSNPRL